MRLIGLTGGIATGKTSVSRILNKDYGVPVINVDDVSRVVTSKGSPLLDEIVRVFGQRCLQEDGELNRGYLRQIIIASKDDRETLERMVIPAIAGWVQHQLGEYEEAGHEIVIVENALMFEKGTHVNYDEIIVVTCSRDEQIQRVIDRDGQTQEQAEGIIDIQMPLEEKESLATYVIRNDADDSVLSSEVDWVWEKIQENTNGTEEGA